MRSAYVLSLSLKRRCPSNFDSHTDMALAQETTQMARVKLGNGGWLCSTLVHPKPPFWHCPSPLDGHYACPDGDCCLPGG